VYANISSVLSKLHNSGKYTEARESEQRQGVTAKYYK